MKKILVGIVIVLSIVSCTTVKTVGNCKYYSRPNLSSKNKSIRLIGF